MYKPATIDDYATKIGAARVPVVKSLLGDEESEAVALAHRANLSEVLLIALPSCLLMAEPWLLPSNPEETGVAHARAPWEAVRAIKSGSEWASADETLTFTWLVAIGDERLTARAKDPAAAEALEAFGQIAERRGSKWSDKEPGR